MSDTCRMPRFTLFIIEKSWCSSSLMEQLRFLFREGQEHQHLGVVVDEKEAGLVRAEQQEGVEAGCWRMRVLVVVEREGVKSH